MTELIPLLTYSFVMSSTPGPNNVMLTASGANFGYRRTLPHIAGIAAGHAPQIALACLGLGALFARWPALHMVLRFGGAAYLAWLAWRLAGSAMAQVDLLRPMTFRQSFLFQMLNPKGWVKSLTIASVFMPPALPLPLGTLVVTLISIAINLPCISMWTLFGVAIRRWLADPRRLRIFNVIMAASLLVLALTLVV